MATAGTYLKLPLFRTPETLTFLTNLLLDLAESHAWRLEAWAVFPNHYHFMGESEKDGTLKGFIREFHSKSAMEINLLDEAWGRKVLVSILGITDYISQVIPRSVELCASKCGAAPRGA